MITATLERLGFTSERGEAYASTHMAAVLAEPQRWGACQMPSGLDVFTTKRDDGSYLTIFNAVDDPKWNSDTPPCLER